MNLIMSLRRMLKNEYLEWDAYKAKVEFMSSFKFQQNTRKESFKNSPSVGFSFNAYAISSGGVESG